MNYNLNVTEAQNMTQSEVSQLEGVLSSIEYFEGHVLLTNSVCIFHAKKLETVKFLGFR
jgi:hypothetical protein